MRAPFMWYNRAYRSCGGDLTLDYRTCTEFLRGRRVLCAVSGGADSTALLHILCRARDAGLLTLCAAHFEHGIRGDESARDMEFVRRLCAELNVPLQIGRADVPSEAAANGEGLESCARRLRHAFLEDARVKAGADVIALAHHLRDRAETVLMHILRGGGISGAAAMPRASGHIVRPFIDVAPQDIRAFLTQNGLAWREDATNFVPDSPRNALRLNVFPALGQIYPGFERALSRFSEIAAEDDAYLEACTDAYCARFMQQEWGIYILPKQDEAALVRRALRRVIPEADHQKIMSALRARGFCDLGGGCRAYGEGEKVYVPERALGSVGLNVRGCTRFYDICEISAEECAAEPIKINAYIQTLNADALSGACVRLKQDGDFIAPFGMNGKRKSLGDYLTDRKYPRPLRERLPLVAKGSEILWVPGIGISERARVVPDAPALRLTLKPY